MVIPPSWTYAALDTCLSDFSEGSPAPPEASCGPWGADLLGQAPVTLAKACSCWVQGHLPLVSGCSKALTLGRGTVGLCPLALGTRARAWHWGLGRHIPQKSLASLAATPRTI